MRKESEILLQEIAKSVGKMGIIRTIILFGSAARGQERPDSDMDICVVLQRRDRGKEKIISSAILDLEKEYDRNIQLIICDEVFEGMERQFLETILREGSVVTGCIPPIPIQRLQLEPYAILRYDMRNLKHSDKMRLARLLYGKKTRKVYKNKAYLSQNEGLLGALKGVRAGRSSILLPERESWALEKRLSEFGIKTKKVCAWLQKV